MALDVEQDLSTARCLCLEWTVAGPGPNLPAMLPSIWSDHYDVSPFGYLLRQAYPSRWLRIHSLVDSKRYVTNDSDRDCLLMRQELVGREIMPVGTQAVLLMTRWDTEEASPLERRTFEGCGVGEFVCLANQLVPSGGDAEGEYAVWTRDSEWCVEVERQLLLRIADDQNRALWLNPVTGEVFAPYDGGVDIIVHSQRRRDGLAQQFSAWLSPYPSGL